MSGEKWINIYLNVDIDPLIYGPSRLITVDIDGRQGFAYLRIQYSRYRRSIRIHLRRITVNPRWWIQIRDKFVVHFHRSRWIKEIEIHTRKIHMYFVTSVLYEITCITSSTHKQDTDSNVGSYVLNNRLSAAGLVTGGHRASAVHTVRRVPLVVAPLPASPTVPTRVQLSSAEMDVLASQQDEVMVILHPARVLHVEHQDLALSARLPSQRPRRT